MAEPRRCDLALSVRDWRPADLARRLAGVVDGAFSPYRVDANSDRRWVLDVSNNWWLEVSGGRARLSYRYGKPEAFWEALGRVLGELLELRAGPAAEGGAHGQP